MNLHTNIYPLKTIIFCGERSPWGFSHLQSLLVEPRVDIVRVVFATEERWNKFRKDVKGEEYNTTKRALVINKLRSIKYSLRRNTKTHQALHLLSRHDIEVMFCDDVNSLDNIEIFSSFNADILFCSAYPQIFNRELLSMCKLGSFNSHPSLLPRCRGAHPVFWAIASGEKNTGATIHFMTEAIDQGDIVSQIEISINRSMTYSVVYKKLISEIPKLLDVFLKYFISPGKYPLSQDHENATYFRNDRIIHHRIFWTKMTNDEILNLVRACEGSAYFWIQGIKINVRKVKIYKTNRNITNDLSVPFGTVVDIIHDNPVVAVSDGFVYMQDIKVPRFRRINFTISQVLS